MRIISRLNTYYRLLVLIIGTSLLFFILYACLYFYTFKQEKAIYKSALKEYQNEVNSIFKLNSKTHTAAIVDVTFWDEMVDFIKTKDTVWYRNYVGDEFSTYEANYIGIYDLNKKCLSYTSSAAFKSIDFIPDEVFEELYKNKLTRFYLRIPEGVIEVFGATVHPSNDPKKNKYKPSGFFIMARLIDKVFIKNLEDITSSTITIVSNNYLQDNDDNLIAVNLNLKNWKNDNIVDLHFTRSFNLNFNNTKKILDILIIATILNLLIYLYYYRRWVYKPVKLITNILETKDEKSISSLKKSRNEFGHIGTLFEDNNNQRKQLLIAKEKAEESDKLKSSFLANLSHEIRTPMNAIMGFSEILMDEDIDEKDKDNYLKIIRKSGKNLIGIIEDLIEMSKIDSKQITPNYKFINLDTCFSELYHSIKITIPKEKKIVLRFDKNDDLLHKNILTDEVKIKQILTNLITNAIKFTMNGYVTIGYNVDNEKEQLTIWVDDTGIGISDENLKIVFDRFRKIEDNSNIELSGLGLGLSITKAYTELLGGTIHVKSTLGKGSCFSLTIPLKYEERSEELTVNKLIQRTNNQNNRTILIAEDHDINFLLLEKILQLKNYIVLRAVNGKEAVEMCDINPQIDIVFMDIKMPIMDGYEALSIIRKRNLSIPIVANTAYSSPEDKEKIMNAGFTSYISKPLNKEEVYALLNEIFGTV